MTQFIAPPGSSLNIAEAIHFYTPIDPDLFFKALSLTQQETETLRARIVETADGPSYIIDDNRQSSFPFVDLRQEADPEAAAKRWMTDRLHAPLKLASDSLWQNALIQVTSTHMIWFHCCHHAVLDGYSGGMVVARIAAHYTALSKQEPVEPCSFLPLATLLEQETRYRESDRCKTDRAYWLTQLEDAPEPVSLSLRPQRPPNGEAGGAITRALILPRARVNELGALGREHGSTLPQTLTALLVSYIFRVTGQSDLVIGMPMSARSGRELRQTPGMLANAVALRFQVENNASFVSLIATARRAMRGALRHQQYRYEDLRRDLGYFSNSHQITRVGVNIEPFEYKFMFGDVEPRNENISNGAMEDLTIFVFDRQDGAGLCIQCDANPALYTPDELDDHLDRIRRLTDTLLASPDTPLIDCSLLMQKDRDKQTARNMAAVRVWPDLSLSDLINAAPVPEDKPVIYDVGGSLVRSEMLKLIADFSVALTGMGIGPGHIVALALPRDRRMVLCVSAVIESGAAWLPVDIDSPLPRARQIIEDAAPSLVIVPDATHTEWACGNPCGVIELDVCALRMITDTSETHQARANVPHDTAYVTYTSGTTGRPKGVIVPKRALKNFLLSIRERLGFSSDEKLLAVTAWTFDIAVLEILLPIITGSCSVIAAPEDVRDPARLAQLIREHDVTVMQATPTLWQTLLGTHHATVLEGMMMLSGGESLPVHMAHQMYHLARAAFNLYGPTETTIWSTAYRLTDSDVDSTPAGQPLDNTTLYIVDPAGAVMPDGIIGELLIGGEGVATGYLNQPDLTTSRFIADPAGTPGRYAYRTGDRAALDKNGQLQILGRADQQIKIRGMRIEPNEIESVLLDLPEIMQAAVMIERKGQQGNPIIAAYLVPSIEGTRLDPAHIRRALMAMLPPQMIPVRIVSIDALPRTTNGKLDRAVLRALEGEICTPDVAYASTPTEQMLSEVWCELLNLKEVDINTSFFDLGGDSVMVVQMISLLSKRGYELPVGQVFAAPTIALLAPLFEAETVVRDPLAICLPIRKQGEGKPFFCFHPVTGMGWAFNTLASLLPANHPVYTMQNASILLAEPSPETMEELIAIYIREIRLVQPSGPYNLLGWSMGGVIAYGVAAGLRRQGEDVAFLSLLDSYPPIEQKDTFVPDSPEAINAALNFMQYELDPDQPQPTTVDELVRLFLDSFNNNILRDIPGGVENEELQILIEKLRIVTIRNMEILAAYRPERSDLDIYFVRATRKGQPAEGASFSTEPTDWTGYTSGHIDIHDLDCRHDDILVAGNVEEVGRLIHAHPVFTQDENAARSAA